MSRGPGRWQRAILAALAEYDVVPVRDLAAAAVGRPPTRPELVAARRAAYRLEDADELRVFGPYYCWWCETVLRGMTHPVCPACPPGVRGDGRAWARGCPWCHRAPGRGVAVTRDPDVFHPRMMGTDQAFVIPERLSVAFVRPPAQGNTYKAAS